MFQEVEIQNLAVSNVKVYQEIEYGHREMKADIDVRLSDLIESIGQDVILDHIGKQECMDYFDLKENNE